MISEDLLVIPGENKITIVNIKKYILVRIVESDLNWIFGFFMLNKNMLITGDRKKVKSMENRRR